MRAGPIEPGGSDEARDRQARHLGDRTVEHRRQADEDAGHGERDGGVALALELLVGAPAPPDHADESDGIGNGGDHADLQIAQVAEVLDDLRQPEADAVIGRDRTEIDHGKRQHALVRQRFANGEVRGSDTLPLLFLELVAQPFAFVRLKPIGLRRPVGQIVQDDEGQDDSRRRLEDEHPLPPFQPPDTIHVQEQGGERRAEHRRAGDRGHEQADDASTIERREPQGQVEDDTGEEAGFRSTQEQAHDVEAVFAANEGHRAGQDAPGEHDAGDPPTRAEAFQEKIGRHLEQEIAEEEDAGAKAIGGGRDVQILPHGQCGEADIGPVKIGDEVTDDQKRDEPR